MLKRLTILTVAGLTGCERAGNPDSRTVGMPAEKQELVVAVGADEFGLQLNRPRLGRYPLNAGICEPLVRMTHDFGLAPSLATNWKYVGDNTYRFTLRHGVRFHDGTPFNSAAVKYTLDEGIAARTQNSFLTKESVRIIDDTTVEIRPSISNLRLLEQLSHPSYGIVVPGSDPAVHPICTGPFRFEEYRPLSHLSVVRNDTYWGVKARLRRITFRFIPDDNTRALALRAGEVDAIFDVNRSMVSSLKAIPGMTIATAPPGSVLLMYVATHGRSPFVRMSDLAIRRAVAMAIDRRSLVEDVMDGYATPVTTINPPAVLGKYSSEVHGLPFDTTAAGRVLDADGWKRNGGSIRSKGGNRLTLSLITQPGSVDRAVTQYVQAQLLRVGIDVRVEELDAAAFEDRLNAGAFDLDIELPSQNDGNPAFLLALRWYSKSNVQSAPFMWAGARFDTLVTQSLASPEHEASQTSAAEAMHVLVDDEVAAIPLAGVYRIYAMSSKVKGFVPHPSRVNQTWNTVWVAR